MITQNVVVIQCVQKWYPAELGWISFTTSRRVHYLVGGAMVPERKEKLKLCEFCRLIVPRWNWRAENLRQCDTFVNRRWAHDMIGMCWLCTPFIYEMKIYNCLPLASGSLKLFLARDRMLSGNFWGNFDKCDLMLMTSLPFLIYDLVLNSPVLYHAYEREHLFR